MRRESTVETDQLPFQVRGSVNPRLVGVTPAGRACTAPSGSSGTFTDDGVEGLHGFGDRRVILTMPPEQTPQLGIAVDGGSRRRSKSLWNHLRNMVSVSMQSWNPACRTATVLFKTGPTGGSSPLSKPSA